MIDKDTNDTKPEKTDAELALDKPMPAAARRALEEAAERKAAASKSEKAREKEIDGRGGLDPARYGDWEKKGIAVDF